MQPNKIDLTKILKVGDKVYSDKRGWGEVHKLTEGLLFPLHINYNTHYLWYNKFGFFDEFCIMHELYPSSALEPWPQPCPFEKGELVWVENDFGIWPVYFLGMVNNLAEIQDQPKQRRYVNPSSLRPFSECPLPLKIDVK